MWRWKQEGNETNKGDGLAVNFHRMATLAYEKKTIEINKNNPPAKYVEKCERWCDRGNSESYAKIKNLRLIENEKSYKLLIDAVNTLNEPFLNKTILGIIDPYCLSNGTKQMQMLSYLVCHGKIKSEIITHNKEGKELKRPYRKFAKQECEICPYLKEGKKSNLFCTFEWQMGEQTQIWIKQEKE